MSDFTELATAVERKREGKTELWPQNDDAVIVRDVPRLIADWRELQANGERLSTLLLDACAERALLGAERDRLAKVLNEIKRSAEAGADRWWQWHQLVSHFNLLAAMADPDAGEEQT